LSSEAAGIFGWYLDDSCGKERISPSFRQLLRRPFARYFFIQKFKLRIHFSYQFQLLFSLNEKVDDAIEAYKKVLKRDPNSEFAIENLKQLEVHRLEEKAFDLITKQKVREARQLLNQILSIDIENKWAKENLSILPTE